MAFLQQANLTATPARSDLLVVCQGDRLLMPLACEAGVKTGEAPPFPTAALLPALPLSALADPAPRPLHLGLRNRVPCWGLEIPRNAVLPAPEGYEWIEARALMGLLPPDGMQLLSAARQLLFWEFSHRFCGHCGHELIESKDERARTCPRCAKPHYPIQAPAIIVAVTRGDRILLAHNRNFRPNLHSVLAGFVDPGESLEQAVVREVHEEVGIETKNLRYVASQPWPFPNSLMLAFHAEHASGEIRVDGKEIEHAGWFSREALPEIPKHGTIARLLIDRWLIEG